MLRIPFGGSLFARLSEVQGSGRQRLLYGQPAAASGQRVADQRIDLLREAVRRVRRDRPFVIDAFVVTLPLGDDDTSTRWRLIKTFFVRSLARSEWRSAVRLRRGERGTWQRRFWEHAILDDADYAAHVDDVHFNPVKHGVVASPADWPYSTFRVCVERGLYPQAWAGDGVRDLPAGEAGS